MLTIKDLGKVIRKLDPKKVSHLTDEQIGRAAKRAAEAHKSHEFDIYIDTSVRKRPKTNSAPKVTNNKPVIAKKTVVEEEKSDFSKMMQDLAGDTNTLVTTAGLDDKINRLLNVFDPQHGWFDSWLGVKRTNRQSELVNNLSNIEGKVIEQYLMLAKEIRSGKENEIAFKKFVAENVISLMNIEAQSERLKQATLLGVTEPVHTGLRERELTFNQEIKEKQQLVDLEVNAKIKEARSLADIEIDKQVEVAERQSDIRIKEEDAKAAREWNRYSNESKLDVQIAIIANLTPIVEAKALTESLISVINSIDELKRLPDGYVTFATMKRMEDTKTYLEQLINEKYEGLLQSDPRRNSKTMEEESAGTESDGIH